MDADQDVVLDGNAVNGSSVFRPGGAFTLVPSRFGFPQVTTHMAHEAYIQVMSRAGANSYRDAIDRRTIRSVMNHLPGQINTQAAWGGWPELPTGAAAPDANGDGVPDAWAVAHGFDAATPLHTMTAPDGYTYLEKFIHSLTPNAFAPVGTTSHTIRTSFGAGADAQVNENGGAMAVATGNGVGATLDAQWAGAGGATNQAILLRFDLSQVVPGSLTTARLELTVASAIAGAHSFMVYGVEHDALERDWIEPTVDFSSAPGLAFDGASGTLGVNNSFSSASHPNNPGVLNLGQISIASAAAGDVISLANPNLAVFLNVAAYDQDQHSANIVTLILQQTSTGSQASFQSKEGNPVEAPRLVIDALVDDAVPQFDVADFNSSGAVDAGDLGVWSANFGRLAGATRADGDADLDGDVDGADFLAWQQRLGTGISAAGAVPEPSAALLACLFVIITRGRRGAGIHHHDTTDTTRTIGQ
jgi:hypothetical protein